MDSLQLSGDIQKKLTWGPPVISFLLFFRLSFAGSVPFQEKKIDRGSPKEGFFRDILSHPPPPKKKGQKTPISTPPPILQGTDHAIDNFIL